MLTAARLRELLTYDPVTGIFRWRETRCGRARAGAAAGSANGDGYWHIRIDGRLYKAHRLAWLYVHGEWPAGRLDHEDNEPAHNWIANLRPATMPQNRGNSKVRSDNLTGLKGVHKARGCESWVARITQEGRQKYLGSFRSPEEAHAAYAAAAVEVFGEYARTA